MVNLLNPMIQQGIQSIDDQAADLIIQVMKGVVDECEKSGE